MKKRKNKGVETFIRVLEANKVSLSTFVALVPLFHLWYGMSDEEREEVIDRAGYF